ncbi:MAG: glycosyltransferase family protein [Alphaproteobacteria bacterium]
MATSNRIILFKGVSEHNSVNGMVDAIADAFEARGFVCSIVNVAEGGLAKDMPDLIAGGDVCLIFSLNGFGLPRQTGSFYDKTDIPVMVFFVDHPAYHRDRILAPVRNLMMSFPSPGHVDFCHRFFGPGLIVDHIPHAAVAGAPLPWGARDIDVFFSGSPLSGDFRIADAALAAHDADPLRPLEDILIDTDGVAASDLESLLTTFVQADGFLRNRVKRDFLKACGALSLTVCGEGWDDLGGPGCDVRGRVSAQQTLEMMARSKITLNLLPPYYASHERIFQAMANGSVAATTPSDLSTKLPGLLTLPYDADAAALSLAENLAFDEGLRELAGQGERTFHSAHTWDHRVGDIIAFVRQSGFAIRD